MDRNVGHQPAAAPLLGAADSGERRAELGDASLLRQVAPFDDGETGGVNIRGADHFDRHSGERGVGRDRLTDLLPDGVFANGEQDMLATAGGSVVLLREKLISTNSLPFSAV